MNQFEQCKMPYLFCFTDEELLDLWSAYKHIYLTIKVAEERHNIKILDPEARTGSYYRFKAIEKEANYRDTLRGNALMPPPEETISFIEE